MPAPSSSGPDYPSAKKPVLDLDTLIVRPVIAIDDEIYEILSPDEISVIESHRFANAGRRIDALSEEPGEAAENELTALIDQVARKVLIGAPDAVFAKLSGAHKWAIVDVFTGLLLGKRLGVAGAMSRAMGTELEELKAAFGNDPTGASASRGFSGSMAATPRGGFMARLRRWFGRT